MVIKIFEKNENPFQKLENLEPRTLTLESLHGIDFKETLNFVQALHYNLV